MSTLEANKDEASISVIKFLKANIPKSEHDKIEIELKKDFLLAKKRSKPLKKKRPRKKSHVLSRKEKEALNFYVIPRNSVKYSDAEPLNHIWSDYFSQILELDRPMPDCTSKNWEQFKQSIHKADFHGSMMQVVRSKCASYVGKKGICIMDTKNTFKIVSKDNQVTTLPKKECVFEMYVKNTAICVFGKHLSVRPAERSSKKAKSCLYPDL